MTSRNGQSNTSRAVGRDASAETKHVPVLFEETLSFFKLEDGATAVDATLGGGGHARALLQTVGPNGRLIAFDADAEAIARFRRRAESDETLASALEAGRLTLVHAPFDKLADTLESLRIGTVDAILADLGFSSDQIESPERGFSFVHDGPLDMRLDRSRGETAADLVNRLDEATLADILWRYGDEPNARRIAQAIVAAGPLRTTRELADLVVRTARPRSFSKIHPATRTFQALRIAVNDEYARLERFLSQAVTRLKSGGRLGVISFHSGEDRIVKRFFREAERGCVCPKEFPVCRCGLRPTLRVLTKKPVTPDEAETQANTRARSAKLRVAAKV